VKNVLAAVIAAVEAEGEKLAQEFYLRRDRAARAAARRSTRKSRSGCAWK